MSGKNTATDSVQNTASTIDFIDLEEQPQTSQGSVNANTSVGNEGNNITANKTALNLLDDAIQKALDAQESLNNAIQQLRANLGNTEGTQETDSNLSSGDSEYDMMTDLYNDLLKKRAKKHQHHRSSRSCHCESLLRTHRRSRSRSRERSHGHRHPIFKGLPYDCRSCQLRNRFCSWARNS